MKIKAGRARLLTDLQKDILIKCIPNYTNKGMSKFFLEEHGVKISATQIKTYLSNHGIKTYRNTKFKKGIDAHNALPCGAKSKKEGYWRIKIGQPDTWQRYHHYVWEQHYPRIKHDEVISFMDGNKDNVDIGNLELITRGLLLQLIRSGHSKVDIELKPLSRLIAELEVATHIKIKEKQK